MSPPRFSVEALARFLVAAPARFSVEALARFLVAALARAGIAAAARRWPADLAGALRAEWEAELAAIRVQEHGLRRIHRTLTFAGSLAVSPAVDAPPRLAGCVVAAGVTLLAGALFNAVHAVGAPGLLLLAGLAMAILGRRVRLSPTTAVLLLGVALFAFLFIGNDAAVMPFMGIADVAPAVVTWTVLMVAAVRLPGTLAKAAGGLIALDLTMVAGSWHAADVLGVGPASAPAWFPLALLPGGTVNFGPFHADGAASFGALRASGPAFHASDILLANAAAMAGPMLLCSIFVLALPGAASLRPAAASSDVRRTVAGIGGALGGLALAEVLRRAAPTADTILHQLLDNSAFFGFGFVAHPAGRAAVALLVALLFLQMAERTDPM
jgi:hypothetical protein